MRSAGLRIDHTRLEEVKVSLASWILSLLLPRRFLQHLLRLRTGCHILSIVRGRLVTMSTHSRVSFFVSQIHLEMKCILCAQH